MNLSVDSAYLLPFILQAQRLYVETKIGTELYEKLETLISSGTIGDVGNENYKKLVDEYIGDFLPNMALFHAIPYLRFKIENGNLYSKTSETGTALTTEEAQHLREEVKNTGEYFMQRMIDYIKNNISLFPEYNQNSGSDVSPDSNAYYAGMNLERPIQEGTKLTLRNFLTSDLT